MQKLLKPEEDDQNPQQEPLDAQPVSEAEEFFDCADTAPVSTDPVNPAVEEEKKGDDANEVKLD